MKKSSSILFAIGCVGIVAGALSGCKSQADFRDERAEYAVKHFESAKYRDYLDGQKLTLRECINMAIKNNLDLKVLNLEEQVAHEMKTAEMLGMLPELNISNTYTNRNNTPASSSEKVGATGLTYGYSASSDKDLNYLNIDLALSVLDFGLAFFNSQQAADRALMRQQRARRAAQNLTLDVVRTYFQVAAAQKAIRITTQLLEDCRNRYKLIDKLSKARQITPFRAFEETRRFVQMEKRLTNYIRSYENSCVELRSQLGMHPAGTILVDDAILNEVPDFDFPNIDLMEQIALLERPELYETDMQKHINVLECRKTLVMMFPNVRIYGDFVNSSNSFLYHASWYELGIRAAYNLLKLPQQISKYIAYTEQVEADELRTFSQAIGIMAQVRMAHANLLANKERFQIDDRVYTTYKNNLKWAEKNQRITGELSNLELDHMRLETAEYEIERLLTLGNYYVSYYRVFNSMGISSLDRKSLYQLKTELRNARRRAAVELEKAKADYNEEKAARMSKQTMALKEMEKKVVNQPLTAANDVDFIAIYSATPQKAQEMLNAKKDKK